MSSIIGLITVALQIALEVVKYRQTHAKNLGVPKLPADQRKALDAAVLQMVRTKDTSALEAMLKVEPAPLAPTVMAPQPVIPPSNAGGKSA